MCRFPFARPSLALAMLAACGDSPAPSGSRHVELEAAAAERAEPAPLATPASAGSTEARTIVPAVDPSFPGLAETKDGPAPRIADVEITLDRTSCLGWCPVYTVVVRGDGTVVYEGRSHVRRTARAESKIDPALLEPILREMESIDFLRHEHVCRSKIRDSPGTRVKLSVCGLSRTVLDQYSGRECGVRQPSVDPTWHAGIDRIGELVDELIQVEQWIGTLEERRPACDEGK